MREPGLKPILRLVDPSPAARPAATAWEPWPLGTRLATITGLATISWGLVALLGYGLAQAATIL
jgi:hypothetical protein